MLAATIDRRLLLINFEAGKDCFVGALSQTPRLSMIWQITDFDEELPDWTLNVAVIQAQACAVRMLSFIIGICMTVMAVGDYQLSV